MNMTTSTIEKHKQLISNTNKLLKHQREVEKAKGEKFNVFSILRMSSKEDKLHSRFIRELLNPKGSHLKGHLFLDLFLNMLNEKHDEEQKLNLSEHTYNRVEREFHIGNIDLEAKTGGRIDVFLRDEKSGATICIENKIYAGDQKAQVKRYWNYNNNNNRVYYLTLDGKEPSEESCEDLVADEDFYLLSYKEDIINWIELCLKEVYDEPILRESIKQYLILIQKLTHTMSNQFEKELTDLIINNLEEARYIASNITKLIQPIQQKFKNDYAKKLEDALNTNHLSCYNIENGENIAKRFSVIWLKVDTSLNPPLKFGIENFNGNSGAHWNGDLFIGVYARNTEIDMGKYSSDNPPHKRWIRGERIEFENKDINFSHEKFLKIIRKPETDEYKKFMNFLVGFTINYIKNFEEKLGNDVTHLKPVKLK